VVFFISVPVLFYCLAVGLHSTGVYQGAVEFFRKGFYQLISAHTGTGYQTLYPAELEKWPDLSLVALIMAMALGGAVCSTTGAIKMLRVGIIYKALKQDIRRIILPERAIVVEKFHHIKQVFLETSR